MLRSIRVLLTFAVGCPRILAIVATTLIACCVAPVSADDFYAGKQISFIVGAGVGGGYDLQARLTARHLGKHIPGKPAIIVQNMPARIAAANYMFATAPGDGTTIALIQTRHAARQIDLSCWHTVRDRKVSLAW